MYERQDDPMCPVRSLDMYISKLNPECDAFFQQPKKQTTEGSFASYDKQVVSINTLPKKQTTEGSLAWYDKQIVGINTLGSKMKALSAIKGIHKSLYPSHFCHYS